MKVIQTVTDVNLAERSVLLRVDFNVPLADGKVMDATRIREALPTIRHLLKRSAKVILLSHLGRPGGQNNPKYSLRPVARELSRLLGRPVLFIEDCVGADVRQKLEELDEGSVILLENLRFHGEEEANDPAFAARLASYGDAYVNDAFGTAHRAHASTVGVPGLLPIKVAGFLMQKELEFLGEKTARPERPFAVILGGLKVSDKIGVIDALLDRCDRMLIGGAMAFTFLKAQGLAVGKSPVEESRIEDAARAMAKAKARGVELLLPLDTLCTDRLNLEAGTVGELCVRDGSIDGDWIGVDIGPRTIDRYAAAIADVKTVLWNGPMGVFEVESCARGTFAIAGHVADAAATSIVGGGDSVRAIQQSGRADDITFISTGGGASLEFLEGKELPGVAALNSKEL
ncbi:MAG: phosphoglycerate kinase [Puniceicoccales bacterium]|jgi:3-phosphoglycerate kinase|nr:phosphoglycerate kinase [Puniceicoccales bacterium]